MKKVIWSLGEVLLLAAVFLAIAILHNYVLVPRSGAYGQYLQHNLPLWISIMFAIDAVVFGAIFAVRKAVQKERYVPVFRTANFSNMRRNDWIICTYVGLAGAVLFICLSGMKFLVDAFPDIRSYIDLFSNSDSFALTLLGLAVIGPAFEEIFFRGILFNRLRGALPFWLALVIQAVIYGYCQPSPSIEVTGFFLAILYGLMYSRMKSLWSTLYTAILLNAVIFTTKQFGLHETFARFSTFTLIVSSLLCLFVIASALVVLWKPERKTLYVKAIGNLLLWTGLYVIVYYPVLFVWNTKIMAIPSISDWLGQNNVLGFIFYDSISIAIYFVVMKLVHKQNLFVVSNFSRISARAGVWIALLGIAMGVWVQCFFKIPYFAKQFPQFEQLFDYLTTAILPVFIGFLVLHSMYKEIYFRALIYNVLRPAYSVPVSIIVTGVIYGGLFFNWDLPLTIYASAGALIFGMLFEWYRSIWAPIVNEIALFGTYFVMKKLQLGFGAGIVVAMVVSSVVILAVVYRLWKGRETGESGGFGEDGEEPGLGEPLVWDNGTSPEPAAVQAAASQSI